MKKKNVKDNGQQPERGKGRSEKVVVLRQELEDIRNKADERDEYYNKYLKVMADYENTRKRIEKETVNHMKFANEAIIAGLFPIVDNFDMALMAMDKAEDKAAVMEGIKLVQKEFHKILDDNGVKKIPTDGEMFDPHVHEAVFAVEDDRYPDGKIVEEMRAGYTLNDRLLRAAQVKVVKNTVREEAQNTEDRGQEPEEGPQD